MRYREHILAMLLLLFAVPPAPAAMGQDAAKAKEKLVAAVKAGDGTAIGTYLNDLCDLDVPGYRGTYSKAQAGRIIRDFFGSHSVSSFRLIRQGTLAEQEQYVMAEMQSGKTTWKIYFVVKEKDGKGVVPVFHINE